MVEVVVAFVVGVALGGAAVVVALSLVGVGRREDDDS